ncbi:hypothetical protein [Pseudonocardia sp. T1-2H]|uniref:hypothetical protein n=1 Tax=Pseudonocardia sp. T1-2H TaxID=3128899 RepID=UPI003100B442
MSVSCDEPNLVSGAGLWPVAVLAQKIGLAGLVEQRVRLARPGANGGTKALTVVGAMLLGGDSVADTTLLQGARPASCSTVSVRRRRSVVAAHLKWAGVRELDAVTREQLARLWAAGAAPNDPAGPLTIDLDSTICPVYGRTKQAPGSAIPTFEAITRSWRRWPRPGRWSFPGSAAGRPAPRGARSRS